MNLRARTQLRVTKEGYSLAAGARKEQSHIVCIPVGWPPTEMVQVLNTPFPQISDKILIQKSAILFKGEAEVFISGCLIKKIL